MAFARCRQKSTIKTVWTACCPFTDRAPSLCWEPVVAAQPHCKPNTQSAFGFAAQNGKPVRKWFWLKTAITTLGPARVSDTIEKSRYKNGHTDNRHMHKCTHKQLCMRGDHLNPAAFETKYGAHTAQAFAKERSPEKQMPRMTHRPRARAHASHTQTESIYEWH